METKDVKKLIYELKEKSGTGYYAVLKNKFPEVCSAIENWNEKYELNANSTAQKVFNFLNEIVEIPKCVVCGNPVRFNSSGKYSTTCGRKCQQKDPMLNDKRKQTILRRFGVEFPFQSEEIKKKTKKTLLKKYGVEHVAKSAALMAKAVLAKKEKYGEKYEGIVKKIQSTIKERYGVDAPSQISGSIDKIKQTNLKKYGVEWNSQLDSVKEKRKQTSIKNYGVDFPIQSDLVKEKMKKTVLERYGVDTIGKSPEIKDKIKMTMMQKYGVSSYAKLPENHHQMRLRYLEKNNGVDVSLNALMSWRKEQNDEMYERLKSNSEPEFTLLTNKENFHGITGTNLWKCNKCGLVFEKTGTGNSNLHCKCCSQSSEQYSLYEFVKKLADDAILDCQTALDGKTEIDIYVPSKHIGFEYHGLYWHSDVFVDKNYHANKTKMANERGIRLIQIFADEWKFKNKILKNKIEYLLGVKETKKIFARKCNVVEISSELGRRFLEKYHIQGEDTSKWYYGLYYKRYLVAVMSFFKDGNDENGYMLSRYATIFSRRIVGGFSKMISFVREQLHPGTIRTFADLRYSNGDLYLNNGFVLCGKNRPAYWYSKGNYTRIHRFNMRKEDFKKNEKLKYEEGLTERELSVLNGYHRIYDCGYLCFKLNCGEHII